MGKYYSDSANYLFAIKDAKRAWFVRKGTETNKGSDAFQAYDEGSIPFTRSNPFKPLAAMSRSSAVRMISFR